MSKLFQAFCANAVVWLVLLCSAVKIVKMDKTYQFVKTSIVNFKLDYCCWLAPVRVGIFIIAYLNIFISILSLVGTANESFSPTIMKVQEVILDDLASKPIPILAYSTELGFNVLLLCAMYRKDTVLLRVFMYYCMVTVVASTLVYSMVIAAIDVILIITVVASILFQTYMLILVRSAIVEIKEEKAASDGSAPTKVVFSTLLKEKQEKESTKSEIEVEVPPKTEPKPEPAKENNKKKDQEPKLETVKEHPSEITIEVKP